MVAADAVDLEVAEVVDKVLDVLPLFWLLLGVRVVAADTVELEVAERELPDEATVLSVVARELPVCARLVSEPPVAKDPRMVEVVETESDIGEAPSLELSVGEFVSVGVVTARVVVEDAVSPTLEDSVVATDVVVGT